MPAERVGAVAACVARSSCAARRGSGAVRRLDRGVRRLRGSGLASRGYALAVFRPAVPGAPAVRPGASAPAGWLVRCYLRRSWLRCWQTILGQAVAGSLLALDQGQLGASPVGPDGIHFRDGRHRNAVGADLAEGGDDRVRRLPCRRRRSGPADVRRPRTWRPGRPRW